MRVVMLQWQTVTKSWVFGLLATLRRSRAGGAGGTASSASASSAPAASSPNGGGTSSVSGAAVGTVTIRSSAEVLRAWPSKPAAAVSSPRRSGAG